MLGLYTIKSSLSAMAMKEGGHVSKLLFVSGYYLCMFFQQKKNGWREGEKGKSFLENEM
jgi:hypothetical protein